MRAAGADAELAARVTAVRDRLLARRYGPGALATDEVMRRVEQGLPFRTAYRQVAAALEAGERFPAPSPAKLIARRSSTGGVGNLGLNLGRARVRRAER